MEAWRELSSREASRDNRAIDMSWLGRSRAALPRGEIWRDPPHPPQPVEISIEASIENSIVPEGDSPGAEEALSVQAMDDDTTGLMRDLAAVIAERYPLLRNTF